MPESKVEAPERIWITCYDNGRVSQVWLPEKRHYDRERDQKHFASVPYVPERADTLSQPNHEAALAAAEEIATMLRVDGPREPIAAIITKHLSGEK